MSWVGVAIRRASRALSPPVGALLGSLWWIDLQNQLPAKIGNWKPRGCKALLPWGPHMVRHVRVKKRTTNQALEDFSIAATRRVQQPNAPKHVVIRPPVRAPSIRWLDGGRIPDSWRNWRVMTVALLVNVVEDWGKLPRAAWTEVGSRPRNPCAKRSWQMQPRIERIAEAIANTKHDGSRVEVHGVKQRRCRRDREEEEKQYRRLQKSGSEMIVKGVAIRAVLNGQGAGGRGGATGNGCFPEEISQIISTRILLVHGRAASHLLLPTARCNNGVSWSWLNPGAVWPARSHGCCHLICCRVHYFW